MVVLEWISEAYETLKEVLEHEFGNVESGFWRVIIGGIIIIVILCILSLIIGYIYWLVIDFYKAVSLIVAILIFWFIIEFCHWVYEKVLG